MVQIEELNERDFKDNGTIQKKSQQPKEAKEANIVLWYADWCGHCKHFKPIFEQFAKNAPAQLKLYKVDLDKVSDDFREKIENFTEYTVRGIPTIVGSTSNGTIRLFAGERNMQNLRTFASSLIGGLISELPNASSNPLLLSKQQRPTYKRRIIIKELPIEASVKSVKHVTRNSIMALSNKNRKTIKKKKKEPLVIPRKETKKVSKKGPITRSMAKKMKIN